MDWFSVDKIAIGAFACAYAATAVALARSVFKSERSPLYKAADILKQEEPELMKVPLERKESLRSEELKADAQNRVVEVENFMKDVSDQEIPNPLVVPESQKIRSGSFLTYKSCIPTGAFTLEGRQYRSEKELLEATRYKKAGPKAHLHYDPNKVKAAIVTCGGICPGTNAVIRELVMILWYGYGVREIYGVKYGYEGFWKITSDGDCYVKMMPDLPPNLKGIPKNIIGVKDLHNKGGTVLASSRGGFDAEKIVEALQTRGINQVYAIGGDGTHRGLLALSKVLKQRKIEVSLIGIPKTIDNDMPIIDKTFGFDTAVEVAMWAIQCADVEANSAEYGVGLVKVMGRYAGHIAMHASLANRDVNICLIPESPFDVYGPKGLMEYVMKRLRERHHCVIVVAEGVGTAMRDVKLEKTGVRDPSGNIIPPVRHFCTFFCCCLRSRFLEEKK